MALTLKSAGYIGGFFVKIKTVALMDSSAILLFNEKPKLTLYFIAMDLIVIPLSKCQ